MASPSWPSHISEPFEDHIIHPRSQYTRFNYEYFKGIFHAFSHILIFIQPPFFYFQLAKSISHHACNCHCMKSPLVLPICNTLLLLQLYPPFYYLIMVSTPQLHPTQPRLPIFIHSLLYITENFLVPNFKEYFESYQFSSYCKAR